MDFSFLPRTVLSIQYPFFYYVQGVLQSACISLFNYIAFVKVCVISNIHLSTSVETANEECMISYISSLPANYIRQQEYI